MIGGIGGTFGVINGTLVGLEALQEQTPSASFSRSTSGLTITTNASNSSGGSSPIVSYRWDFGDGTVEESVTTDTEAASPIATHAYAVAGSYIVGLIVTNQTGEEAMMQMSVSVSEPIIRPTAVSNLRITNITKDSYTIEWEAATISSGTIDQYRIRESVRTDTGTWGSAYYVTQVGNGTFKYVRTGRLPDTDYRPAVEAKSGSYYGPRSYVETRTLSEITVIEEPPVTPLTELGTLSYNFHADNAVTAPDTVDPLLNRVQSVTSTTSSTTLQSTSTEAYQPFLMTENGVNFLRYDGSGDRLYTSSSSSYNRGRELIAAGVRFRLPADTTRNTGTRRLNGDTNNRHTFRVVDGVAHVGGSRGLTGDVLELYPGGGDLRDGKWHTIVSQLYYLGERIKFLLDGVVVYDGPAWSTSESTGNSAETNHSLTLGATSGGSDTVDGDIRQWAHYRAGVVEENLPEIHKTLMSNTSALPPTPTGVIAMAADSGSILVSWNEAVGAAHYQVQNYETGAVLATVPGTETSALCTGLQDDVTYNVTVRAVNIDNYASPPSTIVPVTPTDAPLLEDNLRSYINYSRDQYYPDGTGEWAHLPPWWEWTVVYWVGQYSTFQSPNGEPVLRNDRVTGKPSGTIHDLTKNKKYSNGADGTNCVIMICPEEFVDNTFGAQRTEVDYWRGVILVGYQQRNTKWLGQRDYPMYRTVADAEAYANPVEAGRPGRWYYRDDPLLTGDPSTIDFNDDMNRRMHRETILLRPGSGYSSEPTFYGIEGMYLKGRHIVEGLNVNGIGSLATLSISGYRQDQVSVYFRWDGSSWNGKWPGGDAIQVYGRIRDLFMVGITAYSPYQAFFLQHGDKRKAHIIKWNSKRPELHLRDAAGNILEENYYGGVGGYQAYFASGREDGVEYKLKEIYAESIYNAWDFPEMSNATNREDFVAVDEAGLAYGANPVPFASTKPLTNRTGRVTLATLSTIGPSIAESKMFVHNGDLTVTQKGAIIQNMVINGWVNVKASWVTFKNCIFRPPPVLDGNPRFAINAGGSLDAEGKVVTGLVVEDSLIETDPATRNVRHGSAIAGGNYHVRNVEVRGYVDGFGVFGARGERRYMFLDRVYVHDLPFYTYDPMQSDGSHNDAAQDQGLSRVKITRSDMRGGKTSAILIQQNVAVPVDPVTLEPIYPTNHESVYIDDNFLDLEVTGGSVLNITETGKGPIPDLTVTNNTFGRTDPTKPRILVPDTTKNLATTVFSNNLYEDGSVVPVSKGA